MNTRFPCLVCVCVVLTLLPGGGPAPAAPNAPDALAASPAIPAHAGSPPGSAGFTRQSMTLADAQNVEFVGHIGGASRAVAVQGDYAYIGVDPRLLVLNITNPSYPTVIGQTDVLPGTMQPTAAQHPAPSVMPIQNKSTPTDIAISASVPIDGLQKNHVSTDPVMFSQESLSVQVFRDDFDGTALDSNVWQAYENGGIISVDSGFVSLTRPSAGPTFPYVHTKLNPIPQTGNIAIKVGIQYLGVHYCGTGFAADDALLANGTPGSYDPLVYSVWQDINLGFRVQGWPSTSYYHISAPHVDYHEIEFRWLNGLDEYYVDGQLINAVARGDDVPRPTVLWFGNPLVPGSTDEWTHFKIDYVEVDSLGDGEAYSISGHVRDGSGTPISDVTVSAGASGSAATNTSGTYTITGLVTDTYTLTPGKSGYTFTPATRVVSVPPDATGQDFTGTLPDIGFRPNPDGYSFPNYGGHFPLPPIDFVAEDVVRMFGADAACAIQWPVCVLKRTAVVWEWNANRAMNGGHCDGMASTSLRFFKGMDNPADFQAGASTTHGLQLGNVRRHIAYYFVEQLTDPVKAYKEQVRQNSPSAILEQLSVAMSGGAPDPTTLFVRQAGRGGHAITPYAIEDRGSGVYWVKVYDNNHPNDANRHVEINTTNNTWSYDLGGSLGTWSGDANTHTLGIVPISKYAEQPICPWCSGTKALNGSSPAGQVWLTGAGHLLITDGQGRRIGYVGNQFVNEIPGAYEGAVDGGLGVELEPIYTLPLTDTYTILLDGQMLTQTETVAVTQFGSGYAVSVDGVALEPTSQDHLAIAPDGTQLAYQANEDRETALTLALDSASESNQLQIKGADIGASQTVTLTTHTGSGQLVFDNSQASGGTYDLDIIRVSAAGEHGFIHADIAIATTDTHFVDYGAWDGFGSMVLEIDHGSDGTIDETLELENQMHRIYLPLVLRNH